MTENPDSAILVKELQTLNSSVQKLTAIQEEIRKKQDELTELGRQQKLLAQQQTQLAQQILNTQQAGLDVQQQSLVIQEKQLNEQRQQTINTSIIAANSEIERLHRQQEEERRKRQQFLKNTIFALEELERAALNQRDNLIVFLTLQKLRKVVDTYHVLPDEFEEIADKKYANAVLNTLDQDLQKATSSLTAKDRQDIQIWQETSSLLPKRRAQTTDARLRLKKVSGELQKSQNQSKILASKQAPAPHKLRTITLGSRAFFAIAALGLLTAGVSDSLRPGSPWLEISLVLFVIALVTAVALLVVRYRLDVEAQRQRVSSKIQAYEEEVRKLSDGISQAEAEEGRLTGKLEQVFISHPRLRTFPQDVPI